MAKTATIIRRPTKEQQKILHDGRFIRADGCRCTTTNGVETIGRPPDTVSGRFTRRGELVGIVPEGTNQTWIAHANPSNAQQAHAINHLTNGEGIFHIPSSLDQIDTMQLLHRLEDPSYEPAA